MQARVAVIRRFIFSLAQGQARFRGQLEQGLDALLRIAPFAQRRFEQRQVIVVGRRRRRHQGGRRRRQRGHPARLDACRVDQLARLHQPGDCRQRQHAQRQRAEDDRRAGGQREAQAQPGRVQRKCVHCCLHSASSWKRIGRFGSCSLISWRVKATPAEPVFVLQPFDIGQHVVAAARFGGDAQYPPFGVGFERQQRHRGRRRALHRVVQVAPRQVQLQDGGIHGRRLRRADGHLRGAATITLGATTLRAACGQFGLAGRVRISGKRSR